jgi:hypothetical protein
MNSDTDFKTYLSNTTTTEREAELSCALAEIYFLLQKGEVPVINVADFANAIAWGGSVRLPDEIKQGCVWSKRQSYDSF